MNKELGRRGDVGRQTRSNQDTSNAISKLLFLSTALGPSFSVAPSAPDSHRYKLSLFQPRDPKAFIKFVRKEINLLRTALPKGISVKAYEDRMVSGAPTP